MAKTIAIDLNDVIRDYTGQFKRIYKKYIDNTFEIEDENIDDWDLFNVFKFQDREAYNQFKYVDYPFEIFARAENMDKMLQYRLNDWLTKTLKDVSKENIPNVIFVSPFEAHMSIQATLSYLSRIGCRVREYYFPVVSKTIWDKCDILITANPNLIENKPEGKTVFKIEMSYNKDVEADYSFKSMLDIIQDEDETIIDLIEDEDATV